MAGQLAAALPAITQLCAVLGPALSQSQTATLDPANCGVHTSSSNVNGPATSAARALPAGLGVSSPQLFSRCRATRPCQSGCSLVLSSSLPSIPQPAAAHAAATPPPWGPQRLRSAMGMQLPGIHLYHTTSSVRSKRRSWAEAPRLKAPTRPAPSPARLQPANPGQVSAMLADAAAAANANLGASTSGTSAASSSSGSSSSSSSSSFERGNSTNLLGVRVNVDILTKVMKTYAVGILLLVVPLGLYILFVTYITSGLQLLNMPQGQAVGADRIRQVLVNAWCVRHALDRGVAGALVDQLGPQTPTDALVKVIHALEPLLDVEEGREALIEAGLVVRLRLGMKQGWLPSGVVPWAALTVEYLEAEAAADWRAQQQEDVEHVPQQQQQQQQKKNQQQQAEQEGRQQEGSRWWHWRPRIGKHTPAPGPGVASV